MDSKNNILCAGYTTMYDTLGYSDYFLTAFDTAGNFINDLYVDLSLWEGADDSYQSIGIAPDGHIFVSGTCEGNNYLQPSILVHILDADYNWEGGTERTGQEIKKSDVLSQLVATSDGGCIMIGTTADLGAHISDVFVFKIGQEPSNMSPIQHFLLVGNFSKDFKFEIFPNPATKVTHLSWNDAPKGKTEITLYDLAARKILSLEHDFSIESEMTLCLPNIPHGIYLLQIQNRNVGFIRKIKTM